MFPMQESELWSNSSGNDSLLESFQDLRTVAVAVVV
jgi:hypothetical protein